MENFGVYTEVDPNGKLTVTASKAEVVDADQDENIYLYTNKGIDYFNEIQIDFELFINSASLDDGFGGMAVANTVGTVSQFVTTDISCIAWRVGTAFIFLIRGDEVTTDYYAANFDTLYYCTLKRAADSDTVTLEIYSDAARTILLDTLTVSGFGAGTKYRYCYGFVNRNSGLSGRDFDGYVQNMTIWVKPRWDFFTWS